MLGHTLRSLAGRPSRGLLVAALLSGCFFAAACNKDEPAPQAAAPTPATAPAPTTQPGRIGPGDLLVINVGDLTGPGSGAAKPVRIGADGTVGLLFLDQPFRVAGMTPADAEVAIGKVYCDENIIQQPNVYVRRLQVAASSVVPTTGPSATIGNFDLLRLAVWELEGPGTQTVRVTRVGGDGSIGLPMLGKLKVAGLTEAEAERAVIDQYGPKNQVLQHPMVSVLRLEPAPDDAGRVELPNVAVRPVPEILKPLFEPGRDVPMTAAPSKR